jgi:hypothetical protein
VSRDILKRWPYKLIAGTDKKTHKINNTDGDVAVL